MVLAADKLEAELARGLRPVYLISGDDPLLTTEAADAVRSAARAAGYQERTVFHVDARFNWQELAAAGASLSLFADRRLLELRMPTGKPGATGGKALADYAGAPAEDTILLVLTGRLDKATQRTAWFKALQTAGIAVQIWPVERRNLPGWIGRRMRGLGLRPGPGAAELIADRVEGNLLAADQEIRKLALLLPAGDVTADDVLRAVSDSARFDVFGLIDAISEGDRGRSQRILTGLAAEGVAPTLVLWAIVREIRALANVAWQTQHGQGEAQAMRAAGIWPRRQPLARKALQRHRLEDLHDLLRRAARTDQVLKGLLPGRPWMSLTDLVGCAAGRSRRPVRGAA